MCWRKLWTALIAILILTIASPPVWAQGFPFCPPGKTPAFVLGFAALKGVVGAAMGEPLECEHTDPATGDAHQRTTTGLAFYRKSTNTATFTDGWRHWALVAGSVVYWEGGASDPPSVATAPVAAPVQTPAPLPAPPQGPGPGPSDDTLVLVEEVVAPEALIVRNAAGERFVVVHLGIIGPSVAQGDWRARATDVHRALLPPGTVVVLFESPGFSPPTNGVLYRHVVRRSDLGSSGLRTVAAELLRAGVVWVFPHTTHANTLEYASIQADAVLAQAGFWGESGSTTVFRPAGETFGGFPTQPALLPALKRVDAEPVGHSLLKYLRWFPVEIGISPQERGAIGSFDPRHYTIQLDPGVLGAAPESIAAVLMHELVHARQMMERHLDGVVQDCYADEFEAFDVQSLYWFTIHGVYGKHRPTHWLDLVLNADLEAKREDRLWERVRGDYVEQCSAA